MPPERLAGPLDKRQTEVGRMFDLITPTYDRLNGVMSLGLDRRWREIGLEQLQAARTDLVLDVATGTGDMADGAGRIYGCPVVGLDLSRNMLNVALDKNRQMGREGTYILVRGDALAMPFRDGVFDRVVVAFGIRNMPSVDAFLGEVGRVLRPGGRLVMVELSQPSNPVLRFISSTYLTKLLPLIATLQGGDATAYRYLSASIISFPNPSQIERMVEDRGLGLERSRSLSLGACHLYVAVKESVPR